MLASNRDQVRTLLLTQVRREFPDATPSFGWNHRPFGEPLFAHRAIVTVGAARYAWVVTTEVPL